MVLQTSGLRRVNGDTSVAAHRNVGDGERWFSVVGGAALAVYGVDRRDVQGGLRAVLGAELIRRGATGHCLVYDALNVSTASDAVAHGPHRDLPASPAATVRASRSVKIEHTITVKRPAEELYTFWRDPANVPRIVEMVESVDEASDTTARWRVRGPGGVNIEWDAQIINDIPNELLAWKSVGDADSRTRARSTSVQPRMPEAPRCDSSSSTSRRAATSVRGSRSSSDRTLTNRCGPRFGGSSNSPRRARS
jgi:uncharacterized membrane protein